MKVFELHRTIALFEQNVQTAFVKKPNKFQVQVENFHTFPNRKKKFSLAVWKSVKLCQFFEQEAWNIHSSYFFPIHESLQTFWSPLVFGIVSWFSGELPRCVVWPYGFSSLSEPDKQESSLHVPPGKKANIYDNKKQCSRQLQCDVPCGVGNVINSSLFIKSSLSSLSSTSHAGPPPSGGGVWQGRGSGRGRGLGEGEGAGDISSTLPYTALPYGASP